MSKGKSRGYRWEKEVAAILDGERWRAGPGVDVKARGYTVECKSQQDYKGFAQLLDWLEQASKYSDRWALAVRLGLRNKKKVFVVISMDEFERLTRNEPSN